MSLFSNDNELKEEMDNLGLKDWQKEEVREDRYSPWNFDEEDTEDEDDE